MVLLTGAHITKILLEDTQSSDVVATGVEFVKDGQTLVAKPKREVILCAGTLSFSLVAGVFLRFSMWVGTHQTPQILELSGRSTTPQSSC